MPRGSPIWCKLSLPFHMLTPPYLSNCITIEMVGLLSSVSTEYCRIMQQKVAIFGWRYVLNIAVCHDMKYSLYSINNLVCMHTYTMCVNIYIYIQKCMIKYASRHIGHLRSDLQPHIHNRPKGLKLLFYMTQDYLEKHDVKVMVSFIVWMHVVLCHLDPLLTFLLLTYVVGSEHSSQVPAVPS